MSHDQRARLERFMHEQESLSPAKVQAALLAIADNYAVEFSFEPRIMKCVSDINAAAFRLNSVIDKEVEKVWNELPWWVRLGYRRTKESWRKAQRQKLTMQAKIEAWHIENMT